MADEIRINVPWEDVSDEGLKFLDNLASGAEPVNEANVRQLAKLLAANARMTRALGTIWDRIQAAGSIRVG